MGTKFDSDMRLWSGMQAVAGDEDGGAGSTCLDGGHIERWPSGGRAIQSSYWLSCNQSQTNPWPGKIEKSQMLCIKIGMGI